MWASFGTSPVRLHVKSATQCLASARNVKSATQCQLAIVCHVPCSKASSWADSCVMDITKLQRFVNSHVTAQAEDPVSVCLLYNLYETARLWNSSMTIIMLHGVWSVIDDSLCICTAEP